MEKFEETSWCKACKKEVIPDLRNNRFVCPDCNKFVLLRKKVPILESEPTKKFIPKSMPIKVKLSGEELEDVEKIIKSGFATDFNDLIKNSIKAAKCAFLKLEDKPKQDSEPKDLDPLEKLMQLKMLDSLKEEELKRKMRIDIFY